MEKSHFKKYLKDSTFMKAFEKSFHDILHLIKIVRHDIHVKKTNITFFDREFNINWNDYDLMNYYNIFKQYLSDGFWDDNIYCKLQLTGFDEDLYMKNKFSFEDCFFKTDVIIREDPNIYNLRSKLINCLRLSGWRNVTFTALHIRPKYYFDDFDCFKAYNEYKIELHQNLFSYAFHRDLNRENKLKALNGK